MYCTETPVNTPVSSPRLGPSHPSPWDCTSCMIGWQVWGRVLIPFLVGPEDTSTLPRPSPKVLEGEGPSTSRAISGVGEECVQERWTWECRVDGLGIGCSRWWVQVWGFGASEHTSVFIMRGPCMQSYLTGQWPCSSLCTIPELPTHLNLSLGIQCAVICIIQLHC